MPRITPLEVDKFIQDNMYLLMHHTAEELFQNHGSVVIELLKLEYLKHKDGKPETFKDLEKAHEQGKFGNTKFYIWLKNAKKKRVLSTKEVPEIKEENTTIIKKTIKTIKKEEVKDKEVNENDKIVIYNTPIHKTIQQTIVKAQINLKTKMAIETLEAIEGQIKNIKEAQNYILTKHKKDYAEVIITKNNRKKRLDQTIKILDQQFKEYMICLRQKESELQTEDINDANRQTTNKFTFYKNNIKDLLEMQEKFQKLENQYFDIMRQTYDIRDKIASEICKLPDALVKMQLAIQGMLKNEKEMIENGVIDVEMDSQEKTKNTSINAILEQAKQSALREIND